MYVSNFINRVKLEESVERANALARIDTLTGAMNRRGFFEMLEGWWAWTAVEQIHIGNQQTQFRVTVSIGLANGNAADCGYDKLINQADIALYHSKQNGRNQVSEYEEAQGEKARRIRDERLSEYEAYRGTEKRTGDER